ncbi:DUF6933 domain-containing protein [Ruminococcus sp.]|uniref:DUF6933 domain-containing protein n=1 Tax=Ruminococcus sp. TaxID=41978 RepID=UPI003869DFD5
MIIYATKQTVDRYGIKMPENFQDPIMRQIALDVYNSEKDNRLLEWGAKLFYFDRRKCIQICHFASKLTVVLVDIKKADLESVGELVARYLIDIYSDNKRMTNLLKQFFKEHPLVCFAELTDRIIISTMNRFQNIYLEDGYRLYDFIENGILKTIDLNRNINRKYLVSDKIDGKTQYYYPAERFEELLINYYK